MIDTRWIINTTNDNQNPIDDQNPTVDQYPIDNRYPADDQVYLVTGLLFFKTRFNHESIFFAKPKILLVLDNY